MEPGAWLVRFFSAGSFRQKINVIEVHRTSSMLPTSR
jgi:hypothetical protein